jgi:hypothetical protein
VPAGYTDSGVSRLLVRKRTLSMALRLAGATVGALLKIGAVLILLANIAVSVVLVAVVAALVWPAERGEHEAGITILLVVLLVVANLVLYGVVWGLNKAARRCMESSAEQHTSKAFSRIWDRMYGMVLILTGILLGAFVASEVLTPQTESVLILILRLCLASFVAVGAIAIGFQRITNRSLGKYERFVKPDDWIANAPFARDSKRGKRHG